MRGLPRCIHVEQVDEEIVGQRLRPVGKDAVFGLSGVRIQGAQAAYQNRHLGSSQRQQLRPIHQQFFSRQWLPVAQIIAESVGGGFERAKEWASVCSCEASVRPGEKGTFTSCPAFFAADSTAAQPPRTIRSASDTFLLAGLRVLNSFWIASSFCSIFAS